MYKMVSAMSVLIMMYGVFFPNNFDDFFMKQRGKLNIENQNNNNEYDECNELTEPSLKKTIVNETQNLNTEKNTIDKLPSKALLQFLKGGLEYKISNKKKIKQNCIDSI